MAITSIETPEFANEGDINAVVPNTANDFEVRYDLTPEEIEEQEAQLHNLIKEKYGEHEDLYTVWISPHHPAADVVRSYEKIYWKDIREIMEPHESESMFLAIFDTRNGLNRIVHGTRVSKIKDPAPGPEDDSTGLILIDDIVNSDQNFSTREFINYYKERGIDLSKSYTVETNFRIRKTERYKGLSIAQVGYLAVFQLFDKGEIDDTGHTMLFASINNLTVRSLKEIGLEYENIANRSDLKIPLSEGKFDPDYTAVAIPSTSKNVSTFRNLESLAAPTLSL